MGHVYIPSLERRSAILSTSLFPQLVQSTQCGLASLADAFVIDIGLRHRLHSQILPTASLTGT
jgi:hypothetical protein